MPGDRSKAGRPPAGTLGGPLGGDAERAAPSSPDRSEADPAPTRAAALAVEAFRGDRPTKSLEEWYALWERDLPFPIETHRSGLLARAIVWCKRLLRPLVSAPQADLWDRQRTFNLILLESLRAERDRFEQRVANLERRADEIQGQVEGFLGQGLQELVRYHDALYFRVDQKLDRARRETAEQSALLRAALATLPAADPAAVRERLEESRYVALEDRHRGERTDIRARVERYVADLAGRAPILDLGCGRGEALEVLRERGLEARGVDRSSEMVRRCSERGLHATRSDLLAALATVEPQSLGAVVSFHVVEHLEAPDLDRLVDLAWRALRPGGLLLVETPNPESLLAGASRFWIDPTHVRPVHPERLRALLASAGFEVEIRPCSPFPDAERLPEVTAPPGSDERLVRLAHELNLLRDRLDDLLFGSQDFAALGVKPAP